MLKIVILVTNRLIPINHMKNEISLNEVVKIYKMYGMKITIEEAEHVSFLMYGMIRAVKKIDKKITPIRVELKNWRY